MHFGDITLAEALRRFEREAVHGVCDTGRYRCPFYTWGQGPTLVCIPGLADDARAFVMPIALLSRHFRCVAYDWPTGTADGARVSGYRHSDYVGDLFALLNHLDAAEAFVLGYSFGSTVALSAMNTRPQRLPRAALLGGFAHRSLAPAEVLLASWGRYWKGPLKNLPFRNKVLHACKACGFDQREPAVWDYFLQRTGALPMAAMAQRALVLHHIDLRPVLPAIRQPTLLVCGDADPLVDKRCETELLTGLPRVIRIELPRCGHQAIYTHPEALAQTVADFLLGRWRILADGSTEEARAK
jgi:pimeloyl-ACP methyl ester carboxylesterase